MRLIYLTGIVISFAILSSCTSQQQDFEKGIQIAKESPSARELVIAKCMSQSFPPETLDEIAFYVRSQRSQAKQLFCQRLMSGFASGKIGYADYKAMIHQRKATPALVAVLKGR